MAQRRTRSKYWQTRSILGGDSRTLRERVESWSRQQIAHLDVADSTDELASRSLIAETSETIGNLQSVEGKLLEDMSEKTVRELVAQRRQSDRPFAGVSTQTLVRRLQQSILSEEAQRQVAREISLRSDKPVPK